MIALYPDRRHPIPDLCEGTNVSQETIFQLIKSRKIASPGLSTIVFSSSVCKMTTQKKALVKSYNLIQGDSDNVRPHISRLKQQREIERKRKAVRRLRKLLTVQREYDAPIVGTPDTKRKRIINIDRGNREQVCRLIVKDLQTVGRVQ